MDKTILCGVLPLIPALATAQQTTDKDALPNIVYIMTDDHAFQALSAYGHPVGRVAPTPNMDRLARSGMLFREAFVENSISAPSRATLLTGMYSRHHHCCPCSATASPATGADRSTTSSTTIRR